MKIGGIGGGVNGKRKGFSGSWRRKTELGKELKKMTKIHYVNV